MNGIASKLFIWMYVVLMKQKKTAFIGEFVENHLCMKMKFCEIQLRDDTQFLISCQNETKSWQNK